MKNGQPAPRDLHPIHQIYHTHQVKFSTLVGDDKKQAKAMSTEIVPLWVGSPNIQD